jgi:hypothetical protein
MFNRQIYIQDKNSPKECLEGFKTESTETFDIYYHQLNELYKYQCEQFTCIIIGIIVDPEQSKFNLTSLLQEGEIVDFSSINALLNRCIGRFYLYYQGPDGQYLRTDPTSLAQLNYSQLARIAATDINLIKTLSSELTINESAHQFYKNTFPSKGNGNAWVGSETIYQEINKVLPNHVLNLDDFTVTRYWPTQEFQKGEFTHSVKLIANDLKGTLLALSKKAPLSIAITGGNDSRIMLAAAKGIPNSYYFIDMLSFMSDSHSDVVLGKELCKKANVKYHIHSNFTHLKDIPKSFKKEFTDSVFYSTDKRLPEVFFYKQKLAKHINICGVGEFGRSVYGQPNTNCSVTFLCHKYQCGQSKYAKRVVTDWRDKYKADAIVKSYPMNTLFYMEQRLGNWGAVGNAESDISFEEVNPFASHYIMGLMLQLDAKYTNYSDCKLFKELIIEMAPELDGIPINPAINNKEKWVKKIKASAVFPYIDSLKAMLNKSFKSEVD